MSAARKESQEIFLAEITLCATLLQGRSRMGPVCALLRLWLGVSNDLLWSNLAVGVLNLHGSIAFVLATLSRNVRFHFTTVGQLHHCHTSIVDQHFRTICSFRNVNGFSCSSSASLADQYTVRACLAIRRTRPFLNLIHRTLAGVFIALDMLVIQILTAVVEANSNNGSNYCTNYRTRGTSRPCNCTSNRRPSNRVSPIGVTELVRVVVRVPVAVELAHGFAVGRHRILAQEQSDPWFE